MWRSLGRVNGIIAVEASVPSQAPPVGWSLISIGGDRFLRIPILDGSNGFAELPDNESFFATFWASGYCARRSPWPKEIAVLDQHMLVAARAS
jgi:hypothetical protein